MNLNPDTNFGKDALWKNSVREECLKRYKGKEDPAQLEEWMEAIDLIHGCQLVFIKMVARAEVAYGDFDPSKRASGGFDGTEYFRFSNKDLSLYLVAHLEVFENFEKGHYPTLKASADAAAASAVTWMNTATALIAHMHHVETLHRGIMGKGPLPKPKVPTIDEWR